MSAGGFSAGEAIGVALAGGLATEATGITDVTPIGSGSGDDSDDSGGGSGGIPISAALDVLNTTQAGSPVAESVLNQLSDQFTDATAEFVETQAEFASRRSGAFAQGVEQGLTGELPQLPDSIQRLADADPTTPTTPTTNTTTANTSADDGPGWARQTGRDVGEGLAGGPLGIAEGYVNTLIEAGNADARAFNNYFDTGADDRGSIADGLSNMVADVASNVGVRSDGPVGGYDGPSGSDSGDSGGNSTDTSGTTGGSGGWSPSDLADAVSTSTSAPMPGGSGGDPDSSGGSSGGTGSAVGGGYGGGGSGGNSTDTGGSSGGGFAPTGPGGGGGGGGDSGGGSSGGDSGGGGGGIIGGISDAVGGLI